VQPANHSLAVLIHKGNEVIGRKIGDRRDLKFGDGTMARECDEDAGRKRETITKRDLASQVRRERERERERGRGREGESGKGREKRTKAASEKGREGKGRGGTWVQRC